MNLADSDTRLKPHDFNEITSKQRALAHLVGCIIFVGMVTLPSGVKVVKMLGNFPLHIFDLLLIPAVALALLSSVPKPKLGLAWLSLIPPAIVGLLSGFPTDIFYRDFFGVLYVVVTCYVVGSFDSWRQVSIVARYSVLCLAFSACVMVLMYSGVIDNPYSLRSSFSGQSYSDPGMGRLVTNSHILAQYVLSLLVSLYLFRRTHSVWAKVATVATLIVVGLAGTRLTFIMLFVPLLINIVGANKSFLKRRISTSILPLATALTFLSLVAKALGFRFFGLANFFTNIFVRLLTLVSGNVSSTDQSTSYRAFEISQAAVSIHYHPIFGLGFGSSYMPNPIQGDSWLALNGGSYVHDSLYWFLVKAGFVGLLFWLFWIWRLLKSEGVRDTAFSSARASCFAFMVVSFFWNVSNNLPDVLVLGTALGFTFALKSGLKGKSLSEHTK